MNKQELFEQILEAKQAGTIYHYTTLSSAHALASDDFKMKSHNGHISTSRDHNLPNNVNKMTHPLSRNNGYTVRISLDGDKISEHHKIKPVLGLKDNEHDIHDHKHNEKYRVSRHDGEREEVIKHQTPEQHKEGQKDPSKVKTFNAKPYIKRIDVLHGRDGHDEAYQEHLVPLLKKHGIPHSIGRKFNLSEEDLANHYAEFLKYKDYFEEDLDIEILTGEINE